MWQAFLVEAGLGKAEIREALLEKAEGIGDAGMGIGHRHP
jgi:hypothetical protein